MLADWVPQSQLTVVKNPNFHDAANVKLDKIIYYPTEDLHEELKRYRAGELDITYDVPSDQIKWLEENMADEFDNTPYLGTYYYVINLTKEPLGNAGEHPPGPVARDRPRDPDRQDHAGRRASGL